MDKATLTGPWYQDGWACWASVEDMPPEALESDHRIDACIPMVRDANPDYPLGPLFYWSGDALWSRLFGPLLGPAWWEDATWHPDPPGI